VRLSSRNHAAGVASCGVLSLLESGFQCMHATQWVHRLQHGTLWAERGHQAFTSQGATLHELRERLLHFTAVSLWTPCRSTFKHPTCSSAVGLAAECCRDPAGNPWPPVPKNVPKSSYQVHELTALDVPTMKEMQLYRGQANREGHYAPFAAEKWKPTAVVCARWDRSTDEGALREWLDHHK
jgi:hypothetical protein